MNKTMKNIILSVAFLFYFVTVSVPEDKMRITTRDISFNAILQKAKDPDKNIITVYKDSEPEVFKLFTFNDNIIYIKMPSLFYYSRAMKYLLDDGIDAMNKKLDDEKDLFKRKEIENKLAKYNGIMNKCYESSAIQATYFLNLDILLGDYVDGKYEIIDNIITGITSDYSGCFISGEKSSWQNSIDKLTWGDKIKFVFDKPVEFKKDLYMDKEEAFSLLKKIDKKKENERKLKGLFLVKIDDRIFNKQDWSNYDYLIPVTVLDARMEVPGHTYVYMIKNDNASDVISQLPPSIVSSGIVGLENRTNEGKLKEIIYYNQGKEIAREIFDGQNNNLSVIPQRTGNMPDGVTKIYYQSGKIKQEFNIKNNKRDGIVKEYNENGQLNFEGIYKDDKLDGQYKIYINNGVYDNYYQEGTYKNGKREGSFKQCYSDNNKIKMKGKDKNGKTNGTLKEYNRKGSLCYKAVFKDGVKVSEKNYDTKKNVFAKMFEPLISGFPIIIILIPVIILVALRFIGDKLGSETKMKIESNAPIIIGAIGIVALIMLFKGGGMSFLTVLVVVAWFGVPIGLSVSLAKKKARSAVNWGILSLIFGWFAFIVLVLSPNMESKVVVLGKTKKCPQCAEIIKEEAQICRFCQYKFGSPLPPV